MAERFLSARPHGPNPQPPFPLVSSASFGSARSRPGREAAKRTLDGEDRSDTMKREGKGDSCPHWHPFSCLSAPLTPQGGAERVAPASSSSLSNAPSVSPGAVDHNSLSCSFVRIGAERMLRHYG